MSAVGAQEQHTYYTKYLMAAEHLLNGIDFSDNSPKTSGKEATVKLINRFKNDSSVTMMWGCFSASIVAAAELVAEEAPYLLRVAALLSSITVAGTSVLIEKKSHACADIVLKEIARRSSSKEAPTDQWKEEIKAECSTWVFNYLINRSCTGRLDIFRDKQANDDINKVLFENYPSEPRPKKKQEG